MMNALNLEMGLRVAGLVMSGLVVANFVAAKRLRYAESLVDSATIVRQIFYVHCAYIVVIIAALALMCLGWPQMLMDGGTGRVLSGFFGLFWGSRVVVQMTYYDRELRRHDRGWDIFFLGVFLFLCVIFTLTAWFQ